MNVVNWKEGQISVRGENWILEENEGMKKLEQGCCILPIIFH